MSAQETESHTESALEILPRFGVTQKKTDYIKHSSQENIFITYAKIEFSLRFAVTYAKTEWQGKALCSSLHIVTIDICACISSVFMSN